MPWIPVAKTEDLQQQKQLCIVHNGQPILLVWHNNTPYAIENRCSHAFKPLTEGTIKNGRIQCPFHGATFDIASGQHLSPPAFKGIATFQVRLNQSSVELFT